MFGSLCIDNKSASCQKPQRIFGTFFYFIDSVVVSILLQRFNVRSLSAPTVFVRSVSASLNRLYFKSGNGNFGLSGISTMKQRPININTFPEDTRQISFLRTSVVFQTDTGNFVSSTRLHLHFTLYSVSWTNRTTRIQTATSHHRAIERKIVLDGR